MNRILITLIIILIISISPANAVQTKETSQETIPSMEKHSHVLENIKNIEIDTYLELILKYIPLPQTVKKQLKKVKEEIKEGLKEINNSIDEIDIQSIIEVLGENHPVTKKIKYLKRDKPKNLKELALTQIRLKSIQKLLKNSIKEQENLNEIKELKKTKKLLEIELILHHIIVLIVQILILINAVIVTIGIILIIVGGIIGLILALIPGANLVLVTWGIYLVYTGKALVAASATLIGLIGVYALLKPEEKKIEKEIEEIEEQIQKLKQEEINIPENNTNNNTSTHLENNNTTIIGETPCIT